VKNKEEMSEKVNKENEALHKTDVSVCSHCEKKPKHKESIYCIGCLYERKMSGY
jgi:hypothetical protein